MQRFATVDVSFELSWIYHHNSKITQKRLKGTESDCSTPNEVTIDKKGCGMIFLKYRLYYIDWLFCCLLDREKEKIRENRPHSTTTKIQQDNAPAQVWRWLNWMNWRTYCLNIHSIHQIWILETTTSSKIYTWNNSFVENLFHRMKKLFSVETVFCRASRKSIQRWFKIIAA